MVGRAHGVRQIRPNPEFPMKRIASLLLLAAFSMSALTACNTVAGAGKKDVQKAGEKVEEGPGLQGRQVLRS